MNRLEQHLAQRWRAEAYDCWQHAEADAEKAAFLFHQRKPYHMPNHVWGTINETIRKLFSLWITRPPQCVMTTEEARVLGMETD